VFESHIRCLPARPKKALEVRWRTAIAAAGLSVAGKEDARTASAMATQKELNAIVANSRELGYQGIEQTLGLRSLKLK
jgi:hypothetical protein